MAICSPSSVHLACCDTQLWKMLFTSSDLTIEVSTITTWLACMLTGQAHVEIDGKPLSQSLIVSPSLWLTARRVQAYMCQRSQIWGREWAVRVSAGVRARQG